MLPALDLMLAAIADARVSRDHLIVLSFLLQRRRAAPGADALVSDLRSWGYLPDEEAPHEHRS
jgi:hypothetical protein